MRSTFRPLGLAVGLGLMLIGGAAPSVGADGATAEASSAKRSSFYMEGSWLAQDGKRYVIPSEPS